MGTHAQTRETQRHVRFCPVPRFKLRHDHQVSYSNSKRIRWTLQPSTHHSPTLRPMPLSGLNSLQPSHAPPSGSIRLYLDRTELGVSPRRCMLSHSLWTVLNHPASPQVQNSPSYAPETPRGDNCCETAPQLLDPGKSSKTQSHFDDDPAPVRPFSQVSFDVGQGSNSHRSAVLRYQNSTPTPASITLGLFPRDITGHHRPA